MKYLNDFKTTQNNKNNYTSAGFLDLVILFGIEELYNTIIK